MCAQKARIITTCGRQQDGKLVNLKMWLVCVKEVLKVVRHALFIYIFIQHAFNSLLHHHKISSNRAALSEEPYHVRIMQHLLYVNSSSSYKDCFLGGLSLLLWCFKPL